MSGILRSGNLVRPLCLMASLFVSVPASAAPASPEDAAPRPLPFTGVNLAGGEFGAPKAGVAQVYGKNFVYPSTSEFDYFASHGVNVIRLPIHWEVLQPEMNKPLDPVELSRLQAVVKDALKHRLVIILDPHNYARYYDKIVGTPDVPAAAFADFWSRLSATFQDDPRVWFGLMNEPHDMPASQWLGDANAAIAAIRKTGAKNLILVPGVRWTGAGSWLDGDADANGAVMLGVKDPKNHYVYEVHQYLDVDGSGTHKEVVSPTIGVERLQKFTEWCRQHHQRAFLGEVAVAASPEGEAAIENMLTDMEKNRDVWVGYSWWAAGPWWGDYMFTLEPKDGVDRPQMGYLKAHLQGPPAL
ncbi:cellulase [Capsulimonas corticalis]|uniref:cellulase n=1 Tax=Capsulimonas corticalis TaxID=2219043 RepID=A0A402CXL2_9BACT|nr:glycoside hydrolase family 5 protein [Capsulimonas corticalis]BDI32267.1 cellulase [Capsulimonas corticalis]